MKNQDDMLTTVIVQTTGDGHYDVLRRVWCGVAILSTQRVAQVRPFYNLDGEDGYEWCRIDDEVWSECGEKGAVLRAAKCYALGCDG